MTRKLDTNRLNKLIERIVIIVSLLFVGYFLFSLTREDYVIRTYTESIGTCSIGQEWCFDIWHGYLDDFRNAQLWSSIIGFGLPVVFFGGRALFNYLVPVTSKKSD